MERSRPEPDAEVPKEVRDEFFISWSKDNPYVS